MKMYLKNLTMSKDMPRGIVKIGSIKKTMSKLNNALR